MQGFSFNLDLYNLRKALPVALIVGAGLAVILAGTGLFGSLWSIILLAAWIFVGIYYANMVLGTSDRPHILNIGINGAILAAIAGLAFSIVGWLVRVIRYPGGGYFDLLYFIEAGVIGGLAALGWYLYKTTTT